MSAKFRKALPFAILLLAALALTWPLALHAQTAIPTGSESSGTVPLFNLWTLGWNVDRAAQGYQGYWQAPIFYPAPGAFAFSDPQPLAGLLALPFWNLSPGLAYNLVLWTYLALNGFTVFWLLRRRAVDPLPALLAALLAQALPYLSHERGVLQLQPFFGMLWALEGLWDLLEGEKPRRAAGWLIAGMLVTFLTSEYYGLFLAILLVPFGLWLRPRRTAWGWLVAAGAISATGLLPLLLTQHTILQTMGFERSLETITQNAACPGDYLSMPLQVWSGHWLRAKPAASCGQFLFPGWGLLLLGSAGAGFAWRGPWHRWVRALLLSGLLAALLSLGPRLALGGWSPYEDLRALIPGFENLRSPFRFALWVQVTLALLAGLTLQRAWSRHHVLAAALGLLALIELFPRPAPLTPLPPPLAMESIPSPILFLPYPQGHAAEAYTDTVRRMVQALPNDTNIVNGYSGYFPVLHSQLKSLLDGLPTSAGMRALQALGVRSVCWPEENLSEETDARLQQLTQTGILLPLPVQNELKCFSLPAGEARTTDTYPGKWVFKAEQGGGQVRLRAFAAVPDTNMYVAGPGSLRWKLHWLDASGNAAGETEVTATGVTLLYHGSNRWLATRWLTPPQGSGVYQLLITNTEGESVGRVEINLP